MKTFNRFSSPQEFILGETEIHCPICEKLVIGKSGTDKPCQHLVLHLAGEGTCGSPFDDFPIFFSRDSIKSVTAARRTLKDMRKTGKFVVLEQSATGHCGSTIWQEILAFQS